MEGLQITSVKFKKGEFVAVEYIDNGVKLNFKDPNDASRSFYEAFDALAQDVEKMCEEPKGIAKVIEVRGIKLKHSNSGIGVTITAMKGLKNSAAPMLLNTPFKWLRNPETSETDGELTNAEGISMTVVDETCRGRIERCQKEALEYIKGVRAYKPQLEQLEMEEQPEYDTPPENDYHYEGNGEKPNAFAKTRSRRKK